MHSKSYVQVAVRLSALVILFAVQVGWVVGTACAEDISPATRAKTVERQTTNDLSDVRAAAIRFGKRFGSENVLVVFDIDNTLLAMNQDLGSDQWFGWQRDLQTTDPDSPHLVAKDFQGLLDAQGLLFTLSRMHPPQENAPNLVADVQDRGFPTVVLTSRGDEFRAATVRELASNGYEFASTALPAEIPCRPTFLPYDVDNLSAVGISEGEAKHFDLGTPRPVSYRRGIFMVAGQNKGAMLLTLLARSHKKISAIVFVDDRPRHAQAVCDAFARRDIALTAFCYTREANRVRRFLAGDKRGVVKRWKKLQTVLKSVFE